MEEVKDIQQDKWQYQRDIDQLADMIGNHPESASGTVGYDIFYCTADDRDDWKQGAWYKPEEQNQKHFRKRMGELLTNYEPDAMMVVIIFKKGTKLHSKKFRFYIDKSKKVPLMEDKKSDPAQTQNHRSIDPAARKYYDQAGVSFPEDENPDNGMGDLKPHKRNGQGGLGALGALELENFKKDFQLERKIEDYEKLRKEKEDKIAELQKEITEIQKENDQLDQENDAMQKAAEKADLLKFGLIGAATLLGKKFGIDTSTLMGLAGVMLGGGGELPAAQSEDKGGVDEEPSANSAPISKIVKFLNQLSEEEFAMIVTILQVCENGKNKGSINEIGQFAFNWWQSKSGEQPKKENEEGE